MITLSKSQHNLVVTRIRMGFVSHTAIRLINSSLLFSHIVFEVSEVQTMADVVENFYGVYLLYCKNPKYIGRTYIGFTVNPNRRINQHNKGLKSGGARRTNNKGPWVMVLVVHGFPNEISALRFEWAWQNPERSRRLNHLAKKNYNEKIYDFSLRVLSEMLRVGPWHRLPLTLRWLSPEYMRDFPPELQPPLHMPIVYGHVVSRKVLKEAYEMVEYEEISDAVACSICNAFLHKEDALTCIDISCPLVVHIFCLSKKFLSYEKSGGQGNILPVEGTCPVCGENVLWGDLIRKKNGCYADLVTDDACDGKEMESE
ncbi:hypothetical protein J437_LFUL017965 [Ladona fulva]|uniref:Structure-specific endonuclease subunit SLX1 homolog n=1 Tax=Ladona fulva TaxID=123851 RepID=A0A8K0KR68_LADFU|nr:hypothetical protein J437_LFUL017965 [Ladona fulva]